MGVVGVSVCLSGAAVRGGRGGAARLSYRVCSSARPPVQQGFVPNAFVPLWVGTSRSGHVEG